MNSIRSLETEAQKLVLSFRMVFHKTWRCQHHQRNKTAGRYATGCPAKIDVKIKKVNCDTQRNDSFLKRSVPLPAVIKIFNAEHNHSTECADALRLLKSSRETRATFYGYFEDGMTAAEARQFHESRLLVKENGPLQLANSSLNPKNVPSGTGMTYGEKNALERTWTL